MLFATLSYFLILINLIWFFIVIIKIRIDCNSKWETSLTTQREQVDFSMYLD